MSPKPSPSAIALAASLTSLTAAAQERGADPLSAPSKRQLSAKQKQRAHKQSAKQRGEAERGELPSVDWFVEPFAFVGGNASWISTNFSYSPLPRIAPHLGGGLRFNQDGDFSIQAELAADFVGGTYYFYIVSWYTYAATFVNLPLLARHRIQNKPSKRKHFTWGLQIGQKIGESYNLNVLGIPIAVYSNNYGYYGSYNVFAPRVLSAAIGYQSRKTTRRGGIIEFEMRFNAGLVRLGRDGADEMTSNFMLRWNIVPRKR